ncbi:hypothetical protein [Mycobacterium alsense]|uniref:hypothetical protein n=1 Tax=Mycobacterium alsense TaxID=324058 RepID=UPI000AAD57C7|nr:hypothetical protein [Mycobacterium alsense]
MASDSQIEEALRQASTYLWLADVVGKRKLPIIQSLYSFAARQMVAYTTDGEDWHIRAATAAAHDATEMHQLITGRVQPTPGTLDKPSNL